MNPQENQDDLKNLHNKESKKQREKNQNIKNMIEKKHPNCMTFDNEGKLFVGDSYGQINVWRVVIDLDDVYIKDHFLIKHKEIEGDEINELIIHPMSKNQIYVHSRDNCIRLIDYETSRGTRVKQRFFGSKCNNFMI